MAKICGLEQNALTQQQLNYHLDEDNNNQMYVIHYSEMPIIPWYSNYFDKCKVIRSGDSSVYEYEIDNKAHLLKSSNMLIKLPQIKVKEKYKNQIRIAWTHNVGTNIVIEGEFKHDKITRKINSMIYDNFSQFWGLSNTQESYKKDIGSVPQLENWNTELPEYYCNVEQPWFYNKSHAAAYPIYYFEKPVISHIYNYRNKITDLLRMQANTSSGDENEKDHWVNFKCSLDYLDVESEDIGVPELYCHYSWLTDEELKYYRNKEIRSYFIDDFVSFDAKEPIKLTSTYTEELNTKNPVKLYFWNCENLTAKTWNNYSNYSTDPDNVYLGKDPIKLTSEQYDSENYKFKDMSSIHFNQTIPRKIAKYCPIEPGYHVYSHSNDPMNIDIKLGYILTKVNIILTMINSHDKKDKNNNNSKLSPDDKLLALKKEKEKEKEKEIKEELVVTVDNNSDGFTSRILVVVCKEIRIVQTMSEVNGKRNGTGKFSIQLID